MPDIVTIPTIADVRHATNSYLAAFAREKLRAAAGIGPSYHDLWQAIEALLGIGGKRFRPYVTLLSYGLFVRADERIDILPAAASQELLHLALLIHDDIIDRDTMRYGIPNVVGRYDALYAPFFPDDSPEKRHFSNSAAILAGDVLISSAYELLLRTPASPDRIQAATGSLTKAVFDVAGGELIDTETAFRSKGRGEALIVAKHKTASYSFVGPLTMGAILAGAEQKVIDALARFGNELGIAYQLQDDLLGVFGNEAITGKSTSSDIREGKYTYLVEQFYERADESQRQQFERSFHRTDASNDDVAQARELLISTGARGEVEAKIESLIENMHAELRTLTLEAHARQSLEALIDMCLRREK